MSTRIVLEAGRSDREYFKDLWRYRELLYVLSWRDFSVRYKQTVIGVLWAVLRPAISAIVFTIVFGRLARMSSGGVPYPVLVLAGMLPWQLFSSGLTESGNSLVANSALITKVYFPRLIIPASSLFTSLIDFTISLGILAVAMIYYGVVPSWHIVFLPFLVLLTMVGSAGIGIWISALNVRYRDFNYAVPFLLQLGMYLSPIGFSSNNIPAKWSLFYHLNPIAGIIDGFRWSLLGDRATFRPTELLVSVVILLTVTATGVTYFRRTERGFADVI